MSKKICIFVLDDSHERLDYFREQLDHENIVLVVAETAEDAISKLNNHSFDLICLDHDLGGEVYVNSHELNTGYQVVQKMPEMNIHPTVVIHSWNMQGATMMADYLNDNGYRGQILVMPFMSDQFLKALKEIQKKCVSIV